MNLSLTAILIYLTTAASALLSVADVLPQRWLPYIIVAATLGHAFTPRAAKRRLRTIPPQKGGGQNGRASIAALVALLALCLSLLLVTPAV